jgi:hypothetical protein
VSEQKTRIHDVKSRAGSRDADVLHPKLNVPEALFPGFTAGHFYLDRVDIYAYNPPLITHEPSQIESDISAAAAHIETRFSGTDTYPLKERVRHRTHDPRQQSQTFSAGDSASDHVMMLIHVLRGFMKR